MTYKLLKLVAGLGDIRIVVALFFAAWLVLWQRGRGREGIWWGGALLACAVVIALGKWLIAPFELAGMHAISLPSGHAGMGTAFWGYLTFLAATSDRCYGRTLAPGGLAIVGAICTVIVYLGWHSILDVSCGVLIGGGFVAAALALRRRLGPHDGWGESHRLLTGSRRSI